MMYVCVVRTVCTYTSETFKHINKIFNELNISCVKPCVFPVWSLNLKCLTCKNVINQAINIYRILYCRLWVLLRTSSEGHPRIKSCVGLFGSINSYWISAKLAEICSSVNKIVFVFGPIGLEVLSSPFPSGRLAINRNKIARHPHCKQVWIYVFPKKN